MKKLFLIGILFSFILVSCKKNEQPTPFTVVLPANTNTSDMLIPLKVGNEWEYELISTDKTAEIKQIIEKSQNVRYKTQSIIVYNLVEYSNIHKDGKSKQEKDSRWVFEHNSYLMMVKNIENIENAEKMIKSRLSISQAKNMATLNLYGELWNMNVEEISLFETKRESIKLYMDEKKGSMFQEQGIIIIPGLGIVQERAAYKFENETNWQSESIKRLTRCVIK